MNQSVFYAIHAVELQKELLEVSHHGHLVVVVLFGQLIEEDLEEEVDVFIWWLVCKEINACTYTISPTSQTNNHIHTLETYHTCFCVQPR